MEKSDVISTLNDLIEISKDGEEGFKTAAQDIKNPSLKQYFNDRSAECVVGVKELQGLVNDLGGKAENSPSIAGSLHRHWIDLKTAIASNDDVAVLNEAERGEDVALASYRKAAKKELPANVLLVVNRQLQGVQRNHDRVKQLRDSARAAA